MKKKIILTYIRVMLWFGVLLMWAAALCDADSVLRYVVFLAGSLMMIIAPVLYVWVQGKRDSYWES